MPRLIVISLICISSFLSCSNEQKRSERIVSKWMGREILLPDNLKNVSTQLSTENFEKPYTIFVYVAKRECMSCALNFPLWRSLIHESEQLLGDKLQFVFYVNTDKEKEIHNLADLNYVSAPVYLDPDNVTFKRNGLPKNRKYSCFLLDNNNKVLAIGNPTSNAAIWELYKRQIYNCDKTME